MESEQPWAKVLRPRSLPFEPLPLSGFVNSSLFWSSVFNIAERFANEGETLIVVGKPSELAVRMLKALPECRAIYDAMDDFPAFFSGMSRWAMEKRERKIASQCDVVLASSTRLLEKWQPEHADVRFVPNALDSKLMPARAEKQQRNQNKIFGYIGTIGAWFDWNWMIRVAQARPHDTVFIIGPLSNRYMGTLPDNIIIRPPCSHQDALKLMLTFDVALIPFQQTALTASVDPIKYYEYIAAGLPIITTSFGEMRYRQQAPGVYICDDGDDIKAISEEALSFSPTQQFIDTFTTKNNWSARFNDAAILEKTLYKSKINRY